MGKIKYLIGLLIAGIIAYSVPVSMVLVGSVGLTSCCDTCDEVPAIRGKMSFKFEHYVGDSSVVYDQMIYTNAAGNKYEVTNIRYFISDITLHKANGDSEMLNDWTFYHYVDSEIPSTMNWELVDTIGIGDYTSISFTFGLKGEKNTPFMFVNPPESQMFWPYYLGGDEGGYHYLQLNGFWLDSSSFRRGYNFHLGVGQKQDSNGVRLTDNDGNFIFVQNWFEVKIPALIKIEQDKTTQITLRMDIEEWFNNPHAYDNNKWGPDIMENQAAMKQVKENGVDVFTISNVKVL